MPLHPLPAILRLVYPPLCPACGLQAPLPGHLFCLACLDELAETRFHLQPENPFTRHFAGRVPIHSGAAFLFFTRGGHTQQLLHRIKYHHRPDLAVQLGRWYGRQLAETTAWAGIDLIVPVPLSWRRERQRGFNQSERFGAGLADALRCPCRADLLVRQAFSRSLTGLGRSDRLAEVRTAFRVNHPMMLSGRQVLLVDDVLTTGATLEACAGLVWAANPMSLRLATIAMGEV